MLFIIGALLSHAELSCFGSKRNISALRHSPGRRNPGVSPSVNGLISPDPSMENHGRIYQLAINTT
jgi:hypothetical protein